MRGKHALSAAVGLTAVIGIALIAANALFTGYLLQAGDSGAPLIMSDLQADPSVNLNDKLILMRSREDGTAVLVEYSGGSRPSATITETGDDGLSSVRYLKDEEADDFLNEWYTASSVSTAGTEYMEETEPPKNAISPEDAEQIARGAIIEKYDLKPELLSRFTVTVMHRADGTGTFWWVNYYPANGVEYMEIGCYGVWMDSVSGEVTAVTSAADGVG